MLIEIFAIIGGSVTAVIVVPMSDNRILVFGVPVDSCAGSSDLGIARLRRVWRIVDHDIVNEPEKIDQFWKITIKQ